MSNREHRRNETPSRGSDESDCGLSWDSRKMGEIFEDMVHSFTRVTIPGMLLKDAHSSRNPEGRLTRYLAALAGEGMKVGTYGLIVYAGYLGYQALQH